MNTRFFRRAAGARTSPASRLQHHPLCLLETVIFFLVSVCLWPLAARGFLNSHSKDLVRFSVL